MAPTGTARITRKTSEIFSMVIFFLFSGRRRPELRNFATKSRCCRWTWSKVFAHYFPWLKQLISTARIVPIRRVFTSNWKHFSANSRLTWHSHNTRTPITILTLLARYFLMLCASVFCMFSSFLPLFFFSSFPLHFVALCWRVAWDRCCQPTPSDGIWQTKLRL